MICCICMSRSVDAHHGMHQQNETCICLTMVDAVMFRLPHASLCATGKSAPVLARSSSSIRSNGRRKFSLSSDLPCSAAALLLLLSGVIDAWLAVRIGIPGLSLPMLGLFCCTKAGSLQDMRSVSISTLRWLSDIHATLTAIFKLSVIFMLS